MDTQHHQTAPPRARTDDRAGATPDGWLLTLLGGATGLVVAGLGLGSLAVADDLSWLAPAGALSAGAVGIAVAALCLGISFRTELRVAGRDRVGPALRLRRTGGGRQRSGRPRATVAACPVPHGDGQGASTGPTSGRGPAEVDPAEAEDFLRMFHAETPAAGPVEPRLAAVKREIESTGTYWHTPEELAFGARAAWRNNARCIGRLYWKSLQVRDLRKISTAAGVARHCVEHLAAATNGGKIRPMISIFAPEAPERRAPRIWNEQLIRYAGYEQPDGRVLGDPRYVAFTREAILRGWRSPRPRGPFDVLPLLVETPDEGPQMFPLPDGSVHEVRLEHPELDWFTELGVRWHSVPVISNSRLVVGGVSYPAAPFNGWYMGTEIGARNLGDTDRYDLVPVVADRMGLDTSDAANLWRDKALVEINRAVLHSFKAQGVTITDHHTEADRFMTHLQREERAGRSCPTDWSWIVPPMSGSQTPLFHRYYDTEDQLPNFFNDEDAAQRALQGGPPTFG